MCGPSVPNAQNGESGGLRLSEPLDSYELRAAMTAYDGRLAEVVRERRRLVRLVRLSYF
jgi:hypothetical protein